MSVGALIERQIVALDLTHEEVAEQMMAITGHDTLTRHDVRRWQTGKVTRRFSGCWLRGQVPLLDPEFSSIVDAQARYANHPETRNPRPNSQPIQNP